MRLLVLRFSSLGDVALLTPVLQALSRRYSSLSVTLVTRKVFEPFFYNIPGVEVIGADVDRDYRGLLGLYRLFRELRKLGPYTIGIDVHASIRSRILKFLFRALGGLRFETIVKGRREKKLLTRWSQKVRQPLPHMVERYMRVFERAGLSAEPDRGPWINPDTQCRQQAREFLSAAGVENKRNIWVGIAPFAAHSPKIWPRHHLLRLLQLIQQRMDARVFLFGGGVEEVKAIAEIAAAFSNSVQVAGRLELEGEMALMLRMDAVVAMDSFNMHLGALLGRPVLSIWGATHRYSGFGPYGQPEQNIIEIPIRELECRPCSIFGDRPCRRGDLACMEWIEPELVFHRLQSLLERQTRGAAAGTG
ncbi:MAG: glycosyltransferase family 9 protein [Leptospirales bacterium]|nr:glycosyltransferase family 9 protein [Leptospirales bacterium]